jgi:putative transposase
MSYEYAEGYKIRDQGAPHFLTFSVVGWIDIFSRACYRDIILDSFRYCRQNKSLLLGGYVIMTNHVHAIWQSGDEQLSDLIRDFKTYTSKAITRAIEEENESRREWLLYLLNYHSKKRR